MDKNRQEQIVTQLGAEGTEKVRSLTFSSAL